MRRRLLCPVLAGLTLAVLAAPARSVPLVEDQQGTTVVASPACTFDYSLSRGDTAPVVAARLTCSGVTDAKLEASLFEATTFSTQQTFPAPCTASTTTGPTISLAVSCTGAEPAELGQVFQGRYEFTVHTPAPLGAGEYPEGCVGGGRELTCARNLERVWF